MAKGYWIVRVDIADPDRYKVYTTANAKPFAKYGARFLARGGKFENPEGSARARNAVIEFPSYEAAAARLIHRTGHAGQDRGHRRQPTRQGP
jgi:uncharacterized protein (DUF1330 family)